MKNKIGIISNNKILEQELAHRAPVTIVSVKKESDTIKEFDIILTDDEIMNYEEVINLKKKNKEVEIFYYIKGYVDHKINEMFNKNEIICVTRLTEKQVIAKVLDIKKTTNVVSFYGADSKVGVTTVAQSTAESIAKCCKDKKIAFIKLDAKNEYVKEDELGSFEHIRLSVKNRLLKIGEIPIIKKEKFDVIKGFSDLLNRRFIHPEDIEYIFEILSEKYDLIIVDIYTMNILDGITIGALNMSTYLYLVTTQQKNSFSNYEVLREQMLKYLDLDIRIIVNKYMDITKLDTLDDINKKYNMVTALVLPFVDFGWQAENESKVIYSFTDKKFNKEIDEFAMTIAKNMKFDIKDIKNKSFMKRFFR